MDQIIGKIKDQGAKINDWLDAHERQSAELPLYTSVDIRDAGFKLAAVDTNLFPAGFNNLCPHGIQDAAAALREAVNQRVPSCRTILILAEEHTRNEWYLENIRVLKKIIDDAGYTAFVTSIFGYSTDISSETTFLDMLTASGKNIRLYNFHHILAEIKKGQVVPDLIIMNNDLSSGIPDVLTKTSIPIYPSLAAGWHSRLKSHHFRHMDELLKEFSEIIDIDPWFFSCLDTSVEEININSASDRQKLADAGAGLLSKISQKYREHNIKEKPFFFLKADYGTYGMGVKSFTDPSEILTLNRKGRNQLYRGKSARVISRFLLQEGVPSRCSYNSHVCETCIYQISNRFIGGFYRMHSQKTTRDNLNSKGMIFKTMCPHKAEFSRCGMQTNANIFDLFKLLARIAGIAACREIHHLETAQK